MDWEDFEELGHHLVPFVVFVGTIIAIVVIWIEENCPCQLPF